MNFSHNLNQILAKVKLFKPSLLMIVSQASIAVVVASIDFFFSKKLTLHEFGIWKELYVFLTVFIPLFTFGIAEGFKFYIAKDKNDDSYLSNLIFGLLSICGLLFLGVGMVNFLHYLKILDIREYYLVSLLFPLAAFVFVLSLSLRYVYINSNQIALHTKIVLGFIPIPVLLLLLFYFESPYFEDYYLYYGLAVFISIFGLPQLILVHKTKMLVSVKLFKKSYMQRMFSLGIPLYLANFINLFCLNTDKIIVSLTENKAFFGVFAAGAIEIPIFSMISAAFSNNDYPKLVHHIQNGNVKEAENIWLTTTKNVSYLIYPMILMMMIFSKEIIHFVYNKNFNESIFYFQTYLLIGLFRNNLYSSMIAASGNSKKVMNYSIVLLGINLVLNLIIVLFFETKWIVLGALISTMMYCFLQLKYLKLLQRYFKEVILDKSIFILIILILIAYIVF
jgi:O-antigen/teichoic acid export membrane protein